MEKRFRVEVIAKTANPQQVIYVAMRQDYCEDFVIDFRNTWPSETKSGNIIVKQLLAGNREHYKCLEHSSIVFNCGYFPHSVMQQVRQRVGVSFDCQGNQCTGKRIVDAAEGKRNIEDVFYLRLVGSYSDFQGKRYQYTQQQRNRDLEWCRKSAKRYQQLLSEGVAEEHARGTILFDVRQHWIMSCNVRSLMHLLDRRWQKDAQLECQKLCSLIWPHFQEWVPEIAAWYLQVRAKNSRLAN